MASLGHVAIGMLAGRTLFPGKPSRAALPMLVFSGLALLPDLDYLAVMLGVPEHRAVRPPRGDPLAGPSLGAGSAGGRSSRRDCDCRAGKQLVLVGAVVASHALLDAMTVSSRGVPLFWPITFTRFEAPWRPIPNAPCGFEFLSLAGSACCKHRIAHVSCHCCCWPCGPAEPVRSPAVRVGETAVEPHRRELTREAI